MTIGALIFVFCVLVWLYLGGLDWVLNREPPKIVKRYDATIKIIGTRCYRCGKLFQDGEKVSWYGLDNGDKTYKVHSECLDITEQWR